MALTTFTDPLGVQRAAHLLRRTCCGATKQQIEQFAAMTPQQAVAELFDANLPDPEEPIDPNTGQPWINLDSSTDVEDYNYENLVLRWHIAQMMSPGIAQDQSLAYAFRERLVLFMHTHFTTKRTVVSNHRAIYHQLALFRFFAFDKEDIVIDPLAPETNIILNFKELTKKISVDNAMLIFLDGRYNVKGNPNENYARELLELYAIGKGLEGNIPEPQYEGDYIYFTETDVQEGAKVFSGFVNDNSFSNIDPDTNLPRGILRGNTQIASAHDNTEKTFSERLGNATVTPDPTLLLGSEPTEESLLDEISQLIDIIYNQEETHIYTCRKLYRFFVYHEVNPTVQAGIIQDMADIFTASNHKIQPVLEALFTSREFYEGAAGYLDDSFGGLIKSPLDLVVGFSRSFGKTFPDPAVDLTGFYDTAGGMLSAIDNQGMDYYEPFEVAGYAAYHQYPIYNRNWITTNYLTRRYDFVRGQISDGMNPEPGQVDILQFVVDNFSSVAGDAKTLIVELTKYFLPVSGVIAFDDPNSEITNERLNYFLQALYDEGDPDPDAAWVIRWNGGSPNPDAGGQLLNLFNAMLQSPEYQLM
tara:strand:- start:602 stop:2362 length:1761 start_codon:yes stop_codon:yes gene_type:complete